MKLKCGDPAGKEPATYTLFTLPFAYCPASFEGKQLSDSDSYYKRAELDDLPWRKKYLTHDTADVLFKKAKWFTLESSQYPKSVDMRFKSCGANESITLYIKPPSLILFEWPENQDVCKKRCEVAQGRQCPVDEHNVLRVGFLAVELYFSGQNHVAPGLDDLLELNELFRYWQRPFEKHEEKSRYGELFSNLPFRFDSEKAAHETGDSVGPHFERWASFLEMPIKDDRGNLLRLFPKKWMENAERFAAGEDVASPGWAVYSDSRTFVWTCAVMEDGGLALRKRFMMPRGKPWDFGHWIKLLNVDQPKGSVYETHQSTDFERKWAEERTYKRWEESGTLYGFNYHCGAMLGPPINEPQPPLWKHFRQMYFDQILLLLYIRIVLFRFSMELNRVSAKAIKRGDSPRWREEFQRLRWSFALFSNLYQFPLLSNQQQAIEMYSLARKYMDIDDLYKEVKEEIDSCHEYLVVKEEIEQSLRMGRLTWVATIGLALSMAFGFWGMNIVVDHFKQSQLWSLLISVPISTGLLLAVFGVLALVRKLRRRK